MQSLDFETLENARKVIAIFRLAGLVSQKFKFLISISLRILNLSFLFPVRGTLIAFPFILVTYVTSVGVTLIDVAPLRGTLRAKNHILSYNSP